MGPSNDIHVSNRVKSPTSPQGGGGGGGGGVSRNNDRRIMICIMTVLKPKMMIALNGNEIDHWTK